MRLPILPSVYNPHPTDIPWKPFDLTKLCCMIFKKPDHEKFPSIELTCIRNKKCRSIITE